MHPTLPQSPLADGYWQVAHGKIVNATFWLRMAGRPAPADSALALRPVTPATVGNVAETFARIGADSLWDRAAQLARNPAAWPWGPAAPLYFAFDRLDAHVGLVELALHPDAEALNVEIAYIGVFPELTGRGLGRQLLNAAIDLAWQRGPRSVFLHTCNTDHPHALPLYLSCGFTPYRAGLQVMDDPRLQGLLPRTVAARVPLVEPYSGS